MESEKIVPSGEEEHDDTLIVEDHVDLITDEPRVIEDEARNASLSAIIGATTACIAITIMVLDWILYSRHHNDTFLTHGILMIFLMLLSFVYIVWGIMTAKTVMACLPPNRFLTSFVYYTSIASLCYSVVFSMWLVFYKPIHYDYLIGLYTNPSKWNERMPDNYDFQTGWKQNKQILYATFSLTLILGVSFLFFTYASESVSWHRYHKKRDGLYFSLAASTMAAWFVLYWADESRNKQEFVDKYSAQKLVTAMKILSIICLGFAFLNTLINFFKSKAGYFLLAILSMVTLTLVTLSSAGLWRQVRLEQVQEKISEGRLACAGTMYTVHEKELNSWCDFNGGKYLDKSKTCGKQFLVTRWESSVLDDFRSLNPACCLQAKHYYIWPYMNLAFWGTLLAFSIGMGMFLNLYLSDTTEYFSMPHKKQTVFDVIGLVAVVIISVIFGIYFLARKSSEEILYSRANYYNSFNEPELINVHNWPKVPTKLLEKANFLTNSGSQGSVCFEYDLKELPNPSKMAQDLACDVSSNCYFRIALALKDGSRFQSDQFTPVLGSQKARNSFFPQCAAAVSDFIFFFGTQKQVVDALSKIKICPSSTNTLPTLFAFMDQVKRDQILESGLLVGELSTEDIVNQDSSKCGDNLDNSSCQNKIACKFKSVLTYQLVLRTIKGRFYYVSAGQKRRNIPGTVKIEARDSKGKVGVVKTFDNGIFSISGIAKYHKFPYVLRLFIEDSSGEFLPSKEDILIDSKYGDEISAGEIRLLTKDGTICLVFGNSSCIAGKTTEYGEIKLVVNDGSAAAASVTAKRLEGVTISVYDGHVMEGATVAVTTTDSTGVAVTFKLPYKSYTVTASKIGYLPSLQYIDLQEPNLNPKPFYLNPIVPDFDLKVVAEMNAPTTDFDLVLQMRNAKGAECESSPNSKYCPYTFHSNDITTGLGEEHVIVKRLSAATYLAFVRQAPPYDTFCSSFDFIKENAYHFSRSYEWKHVQSTEPAILLPGVINPKLVSGNTPNPSSIADQILTSFSHKMPAVETDEEAKVPKIVISLNGEWIPITKRFQETTYYKEIDQSMDKNITGPNRVASSELVFTACTSPPPNAFNCMNASLYKNGMTSSSIINSLFYETRELGDKSEVQSYSNETTYLIAGQSEGIIKDSRLSNYTVLFGGKKTVNFTSSNLTERGLKQLTDLNNRTITTYDNSTVELDEKAYLSLKDLNDKSQNRVIANKVSKTGIFSETQYAASNIETEGDSFLKKFSLSETEANKSNVYSFVLEMTEVVENKTSGIINKSTKSINGNDTRDGNYNNHTVDSKETNYTDSRDDNFSSSAENWTVNYSSNTPKSINSSTLVLTEERKRDPTRTGATSVLLDIRKVTTTNMSFSDDYGENLKNCQTKVGRHEQSWTNQSTKTTFVTIEEDCSYTNGSRLVTQNSSFAQEWIESNQTMSDENANHSVVLVYPNQTRVVIYGEDTQPTPQQRRLRRQLQGTIMNRNLDLSFLWVGCFTGYGLVSATYLNEIMAKKPTIDECIERLKKEKPDFTLDKLLEAIKSY